MQPSSAWVAGCRPLPPRQQVCQQQTPGLAGFLIPVLYKYSTQWQRALACRLGEVC